MTRIHDADPVWEEKYKAGHVQRYPWDSVVSFVFRNAPRDKPRSEISILEVGCGTGSNLWFMAREGFRAAGIDASPSAISVAKARMEAEALQVDLRVGSYTKLPFPDAYFDLAVDRAALTCVGASVAKQAVQELRRTLKPGGLILFNPYSAAHGSRISGEVGEDGLTYGIKAGTLQGVGHIRFYSRQDVYALFADGFEVMTCQHLELKDETAPPEETHTEWRVIARRLDED